MYYVSIEGISDEFLKFMGYDFVAEDGLFKLYRDYYGEEHVVNKARPRLFVDDPNDAAILASRATQALLVHAPPKRR